MVIKPKLHAQPLVIPDVSTNSISYSFIAGRGTGVEINSKRWLEEGIMPILNYNLIQWRKKNKIESLKGSGYGMLDGRVADPVDNYRQFMLNGYAYLGLIRASEMLVQVDPFQSELSGRKQKHGSGTSGRHFLARWPAHQSSL